MSNSHLLMKSRFPRAHLGNGIGRYICQLQRVTIKFCKNNGSSRGVRDFIENDLIDYARSSPSVVVYVKPRRHREPVVVAEYLNGQRQWFACTNFTREEVLKWMELVRTQADDGSAQRLRKLWHTDFPSIQGPWTPFTFRDPALNLIEFPNKELGALKKVKPTATEQLIEIFKAQEMARKAKETDSSSSVESAV